jgi:hypothetical protein
MTTVRPLPDPDDGVECAICGRPATGVLGSLALCPDCFRYELARLDADAEEEMDERLVDEP